MMPIAGSVALNLAFGFAILSLFVLSFYLRTKSVVYYHVGRRLAISVSILSIIATVILLNELLISNFDIDYVAHYTSLETPFIYKITAVWAGQAGSLLFWLFILSLYSIVAIVQNAKKLQQMMPWVILVLVFVQLFFLTMTNFITNPFEPTTANFVVANGNGLNPLLQNATMAIHPPMLYLGYIGFTIPFAFAIAALILGDSSSLWIRTIRRWTLVSWLFLSAGVILGGWWAYEELGWGGYWAWDPVENASFMPWLTSTAFIHSIMIQEKKNMLKIWNMILIILTFTLVIFGTFMTRSGIMSSVHAFAESSLGPLFLGFVFLILVGSTALVLYRRSTFKSDRRMESFSSRESGFLFNNVIFIVICFTVFWGTIFPVLSEAVRGTKITVGPPFFNQINVPIGLLLLLLTGVGPLLAWRRTSKAGFLKNFTVPILLAVVGGLVMWTFGLKGYVLIAGVLVIFVIAAIIEEFARGISARMRRFEESILIAFTRMVRKNRSRYGGYIVHLGIVFIFVGFTGKAFDLEKEVGLHVGESDHIGKYNFELKNIRDSERPNHFAWISDLRITDRDGKFITNLHPEKRIYFHRHPNPDRRQPHSELDIYSTINQDIYSVFTGVDSEQGIAYLKIMINPLVWWVWFGGWVLVVGTMVALWPRKEN